MQRPNDWMEPARPARRLHSSLSDWKLIVDPELTLVIRSASIPPTHIGEVQMLGVLVRILERDQRMMRLQRSLHRRPASEIREC